MKKIITLCCMAIFVASCSGNDDTMFESSLEIEEEIVVETPMAVMGDFISGAHPTSGKASVNDKNTELLLSNFKTDNGPKLLLYLSSDVNATEFVNLGDLIGVEGNFTYEIPANTDLKKFKYVNVWCVDFSVSFGHAELK
jgi:hypothetical protein